jgi:SSS family transporter
MNESATFSTLNYVILSLYLAAMLGIGFLFAGRQKTTEDYFLAGRKVPWLVVGMSMYASLTSAVTFFALAGTAYRENIAFLVVSFVSPVLAPFLIVLFYPFYRQLRVTTSYEYIARRFGRAARFAVAALFILARLGWLGTVIYAPAMAMTVVTGIDLWICIVLMGLLATAYTVMGGLAADIWTDVAQFVIMLGGVAWLIVSLLHNVPGGGEQIIHLAQETGRLTVTDWTFSLYAMNGLVVAVSYFFQMMQDYGTDQTTVQRMLAVPTGRGVAKALILNAFVDFLIVGSLLFVGLGLFAYHTAFPDRLPDSITGDRLMPWYIVHALPDGVSGLLITAVFAAAMSSMDSGISCIATVTIHDFIRPLRQGPTDEGRDLVLARTLTLLLGVFATATAFYISTFEHLIEAYTSIISLFNAPILALFLLGIFTTRANFRGWLLGAALAIAANQAVQSLTRVHFTCYFPLSLFVSLVGGYAFSLLFARGAPRVDRALTLWGRRAATL